MFESNFEKCLIQLSVELIQPDIPCNSMNQTFFESWFKHQNLFFFQCTNIHLHGMMFIDFMIPFEAPSPYYNSCYHISHKFQFIFQFLLFWPFEFFILF